MDIHQLKQRIDASGKKLVTLGNEYIKSKDTSEECIKEIYLHKHYPNIVQQILDIYLLFSEHPFYPERSDTLRYRHP